MTAARTTDSAIAVRGLGKRFPLPRPLAQQLLQPFAHRWATALDGVTLEVGRGEVMGLLGPNGAGKTTLLKILATLLLPTEGAAAVLGHDVVAAPARVRHAVGYCVDTERSFYFRLTGRQNLAFFAALNNVPAREAPERVGRALATVGLEEAADGAFMTYSRGMRERLGLARALVTDPAVLLLDEPTRSLDPGAAAEFRHFIRATLAEALGKTVLLVTHSLEEARECCDRVVIMDRGRIVCAGDWPAAERFIRAHGFPGHAPSPTPGRA